MLVVSGGERYLTRRAGVLFFVCRGSDTRAVVVVVLVRVIEYMTGAGCFTVSLRVVREKRKAVFKSGRRQLAFDGFLYGNCHFLLRVAGRLKTGIDRFVDRPERLARHKTIGCSAAGPIWEHAVV